ncbi:MAG: 6-carboxytetrahydropterin synthase [Planctomycetes bacterium]|nr:6-carboxytetrahydropterin synthase [Planctomycetota bacterium]MBL7009420.1 6-carboxytetrahydropterin synthase [Planctomycetota bacterium]
MSHSAEFCAAFRLHNAAFDADWNEAAFGACHSPNFHGHNYLLTVEVEGPVDPDRGMVMDLNRLGALVREVVIERVDHRNLNTDVGFLDGVIPTSENLASAFWRILEAELPPGVRLARLRLQESRDHSVLLLADDLDGR